MRKLIKMEVYKMNIIGKEVNHITDGKGVITAYYPLNSYIRVQFENGANRPYDFPQDFYPGKVLSSSPEEVLNQVFSLPRHKFNFKNIRGVKTPNKNLSSFYNNCLSIFSDLNIPFDESSVLLTVNSRLKTSLGRTVKDKTLTDTTPHYIIQVNPVLLMSNVADSAVYQTLLKLMLKTTSDLRTDENGKEKHGLRRRNADLVCRETGFAVFGEDSTSIHENQDPKPVVPVRDPDRIVSFAYVA